VGSGSFAQAGSSSFGVVSTASDLSALELSEVTDAIQEIATLRAINGAQQSRLQFATEVLTVNKANIEAANSRITDVDVAEESTQLARYNILVQAGTAMLSQANQSAQSALRLIN
jgi:flagellin